MRVLINVRWDFIDFEDEMSVFSNPDEVVDAIVREGMAACYDKVKHDQEKAALHVAVMEYSDKVEAERDERKKRKDEVKCRATRGRWKPTSSGERGGDLAYVNQSLTDDPCLMKLSGLPSPGENDGRVSRFGSYLSKYFVWRFFIIFKNNFECDVKLIECILFDFV